MQALVRTSAPFPPRRLGAPGGLPAPVVGYGRDMLTVDLSSPAFGDREAIPMVCSCDGDGVSPGATADEVYDVLDRADVLARGELVGTYTRRNAT